MRECGGIRIKGDYRDILLRSCPDAADIQLSGEGLCCRRRGIGYETSNLLRREQVAHHVKFALAALLHFRATDTRLVMHARGRLVAAARHPPIAPTAKIAAIVVCILGNIRHSLRNSLSARQGL